jgi:hypothetical protein
VATHLEGDPDGLWDAFRALPSQSRERFIERLMADQAVRQDLDDLFDLHLANERIHEPARPLDDVLAKINR